MERARQRTILFLASGFGAGYLPYCPGTFGTMIAVPISLGLNQIALGHPLVATILLTALIGVALWLAGQAAQSLKKKDPAIVTIDEIAGFALASFLSFSSGALLIAFVLFRFFDIAKIFPARSLEKLPGGRGIVMDDLIAGVYTFLILRLLTWTALL
jgi:phosphatidylglycerophosphatase A